MIQEEMKELILRGKENAVKNDDLQKSLNLTRRKVSAVIHDLRKEGMIICSGPQGYYIPADPEELIEGYNRLYSMAVNTLSALKAMRREIREQGLYDLTKEASMRHKGEKQ